MSDITLRAAHKRSYRPDLPLRSEYDSPALLRPTAADKAYYAAHPLTLQPTEEARFEVRMSIMPAWLWEVLDADGRLVMRFKTDEKLATWQAAQRKPIERKRKQFAAFNIVEDAGVTV